MSDYTLKSVNSKLSYVNQKSLSKKTKFDTIAKQIDGKMKPQSITIFANSHLARCNRTDTIALFLSRQFQ